MAQEKPSKIAEWIVAVRGHAPVLFGQLSEWFQEARKEPRLFWETAAIRYVVYITVGLILVTGVKWGSSMIAAPPPESAVPQARTADFHVLCSDQKCGHHYVINRKFGFSSFPVACPKCKKETGMAAVKCYSPKCKGRWTYLQTVDSLSKCARCGENMK